LPIALVASLGFLLARFGGVDSRPLARASFYLFNPCLAFVTVSQTTLQPQLLARLVLVKVGGYVVMVALAVLVARSLKLPGPTTSAFVLAAVFANSGNFGLSVNENAFGQAGLALAVAGYLTDNLTINSLGVFIAARGRTSPRQSLRQVLQNPAIYALAAGLLFHELSWQLPSPLMRAMETASRAAIPTMLVVLGMQLATLRFEWSQIRLISLSSALRLLVAPLVAAGMATLLGLTGLARQVAIIQSSVPTAVSASIIASQYDTEPDLVSGAVMLSSLASLVTLTVLLAMLM